jgi:hypothetical protein
MAISGHATRRGKRAPIIDTPTDSATLTESDGGVRVALNLSGLPKPDTMYLAHIHPGACAEGEEGAHHEEGHAEHGGTGVPLHKR